MKKKDCGFLFFFFFGWYVGVLLSVSGDNGIIEVLGVTGAPVPGFSRAGLAEARLTGSGDHPVPFKCGSSAVT